jgi:hypothetical protein
MSQTVIKKRVTPSVPLSLEVIEEGGKRVLNFRLSWNFKTSAEVEERTGLNLLTGQAWTNLSVKNLSIMLWAAVLDNNPEYGGRLDGESFDEYEKNKRERQEMGLEAIMSFCDLGNVDVVNDAVWNAYFQSLPKERREALEAAKKELLEAAKQKEARPLAELPNPIPNPQDGLNSGPSPVLTLDSPKMSSEVSVMPSSKPFANVIEKSNDSLCTAQATSPQL